MAGSKIALVSAECTAARELIDHLQQVDYEVVFVPQSENVTKQVLELDAQCVLFGLWESRRIDQELLADLTRLLLVPLVVVGGPTDSLLAVDVLNNGADGYLDKSCGLDCMEAFIEATLRRYWEWSPRHSQETTPQLAITTTRDGEEQPVELTPEETRVLTYLLENVGQVVPKQELCWHTWGHPPEERDLRSLGTLIRSIRAKIERDPRHPQYLLTRWGVGYSLSEEFTSN